MTQHLKRQVTPGDLRKIAVGVAVTLSLAGAGSVLAQKTSAAREEERMGQLMDREAEMAPPIRGAQDSEIVENDPEKQLLKNTN